MESEALTPSAALRDLSVQRHADPALTLQRIDELVATNNLSTLDVALARWVRGMVLHELDQPDEAIAEYMTAIRGANTARSADLEARAFANLAISELQLGHGDAARVSIDTALAVAPPSASGHVKFLDALFQQRMGLHRDAVAAYDAAATALVETADEATLGMLHLNRGISWAYLDNIRAARDDFAEAERIAQRLELTLLAAMAAHNLGFAEGRRGRLADGLLALDRAEGRYEQLSQRPRQLPVLHSDRSEILRVAGLAADACEAARRAVTELEQTNNVADLTEARLMLARALLANGQPQQARMLAREVAAGFRVTSRPAWVVQAVFVGLQADFEASDGRPTDRLGERMARHAAQLSHHGLPVEARDALAYAALVALANGRVDNAMQLVEQAVAVRVTGAAESRARMHYASASTILAAGQPRQALALLREAIREIERSLSSMGSTEARFEAHRFSARLATLGVGISLTNGRPADVLHWSERQRSSTLSVNRSTTVNDDRSGSEDTRRSRSLRDRGDPGTIGPFSWTTLRAHLGDRTLVHYAESGGLLYATVARGATTRLVRLCHTSEVVENNDFVKFGFRRLTTGAAGFVQRSLGSFADSAAALDALVTEPLQLRPEGRLLIVPSASLQPVLWAALPSLAHRPFVVAPSARAWLRASQQPAPIAGRDVFVSGPGLLAAAAEVEELAKYYPEAVLLTGRKATVETVLAAIDGAALVHIAAHGKLRSDSPMFSQLEMADGPLTLYDLERLHRPPNVVVLSSCEAGAGKLYESGGVLGTASALMALGSRTVIASTVRVPDEATRHYMRELHLRLRLGISPDSALCETAAALRGSADPIRIATAGAFLAFGA